MVDECDALTDHASRAAKRMIKIRKEKIATVSCIAEGCECQA